MLKNKLIYTINEVNKKIQKLNKDLSFYNLGKIAEIDILNIDLNNERFYLDLIEIKRKSIEINKNALVLKKESINKIGEEIINIVFKAGEIALKEQKNLSIKKKEDGSLVSSGDMVVNDFLFSELKNISDHILSEEDYVLKKIKKNDLVIVIDPIDGTESYTKKENTWSILLALVENDKTLFSVVYQPSEDRLYSATLGHGAYLISNNEKKMLKIDSTANKAVISPSLIESEIKLLQKYTDEYYTFPSAGLKIMEVVINNAVVYPNHAKKCGIWDLLAPVLILTEAGGIIELDKELSLSQPNIDFNFIVKAKRD